jgi:fibronectin-binding autotransporter adhesin
MLCGPDGIDITFHNTGSGSVGTGQVSVAAGTLARVDSNLGGAVAFSKGGTGTLELGGANNFTGTIEFQTGNFANLVVGHAGFAGTVCLLPTASINPNSVVAVNMGRLELGSSNLTLDRIILGGLGGAGPIDLTGVFGSGTLTLTSNRIDLYSGNDFTTLEPTINLTGDLNLRSSGSSNNYGGTIRGAITGNFAVNYNSGLSPFGFGPVAGVILAGENSFTGGFNVNNNSTAGVADETDSAFGTGQITLNAVTSLRGIHSRTIANDIVMNTTGLRLDSSSGRTVYTGSFDLNPSAGAVTRTLTITKGNFGEFSNAFSVVLAGQLFSSGGAVGINHAGVDELDVSGQNTFTGGWNITGGGRLRLDASSTGPAGAPTSQPVGTGTLTIGSAARISALNESRTLGNNVVVGSNFTFSGVHDLTLTGSVDLNTTATNVTRTINVDGDALAIINGNLFRSGAGGVNLTKGGAGVLVLAGNNSAIPGNITISGGTLGIAGNAAFTAGTVTVGTQATLRFDQPGEYTKAVSLGTNAPSIATNGVDVTYSGTLTQANTLTKTGAGTIAFTNPLAGFGGAISVQQGGLAFANNGTAINSTANIEVEADASAAETGPRR